MTEYTCPAERCDYTASKGSVVGHISAKSDPAHTDGDALREALDAAAEEPDLDGDPESEGQQGSEGGAEGPTVGGR